jgi:hypothetical protein
MANTLSLHDALPIWPGWFRCSSSTPLADERISPAIAGRNEMYAGPLPGIGCFVLSEHEGSVQMWSAKQAALISMALVLACLAGASPAAAKPGSGPYRPAIVPADFQATVDNPYFPLVPGTVFKFIEKLGKTTSENEVTVTRDTKVIMGVTCVVVHDTVKEKGILKEETFDWYAQDKGGNVWYFGEATKEFMKHNKVSTEGSWEGGVDGAQPGIVMEGQPKVGEPYRQEYYAGRAEDMGQVAALDDSVTVPYGSFTGCVRTKEWSMLEAGHEMKWYAKGVGFVRSESTAKEVSTLVSVTRP